MFNSSLRQAARTCPSASIATRNLPTTAARPAATFTSKGHQRRHSSSKPPVPPNDGSSSIPATSVKQVGAPRSTEKRIGAESRLSKRKGAKGEKTEQPVKQAQEAKVNDWTTTLPSVPSTQHLHPKDVYVAAFFSTHRPISITGTLPETQVEDIDKIFQIRPKKTKGRNSSSDVIYTISNAVQSLDEHMQNPQQFESGTDQKVDLVKVLTQPNNVGQHAHNLDGQPARAGNVKIIIEEIAKRFRPFNTPPAPVPAPEVDFSATESSSVEDESTMTPQQASEAESEANEIMQAQHLESQIEMQDQETQPNPDVFSIKSGSFFTSHQSPITEPTHSQQPQSIGGRTKRGVYVDPQRSQRNLKYHLISVKRQRRLKMKKHKYKKLMRKTRNLRRRQDRL